MFFLYLIKLVNNVPVVNAHRRTIGQIGGGYNAIVEQYVVAAFLRDLLLPMFFFVPQTAVANKGLI